MKSSRDLGDGRKAVEFYLRRYLRFLQDAGHNVLSSIPRYGKCDHPPLNFFRATKTPCIDEDICGIPVARVDEIMKAVWDETMAIEHVNETSTNPLVIAFSHIQNNWAKKIHNGTTYSLTLGSPRVVASCDGDIIIEFPVMEILCEYPDGYAYLNRSKGSWN